MRSCRRYWILVFLFTLTFINYTDRVALSVAATPIRQEFHLSPVELGSLMSSFLWIFIFALIPVGLLVDRFGGKVVNACGIALWSAATVFTGLSTGLWFMLASRMVMGAGESTCWPACNRVIREWFPASERGVANAIFGAGAAAGPALGAMFVSAIVATAGWRTGFFVAGAIGFVWLAAWLALFDRPERARWLGRDERTHIVSHRDGGAPNTVAAVGPVSSLRYLASRRTTRGLFLTQGCEVFGGYMLLTWLPSYLQAAKGLSLLNAGMLTAVPFGSASLIAVLLGRMSDRLLSHTAVHAGQRRIMLAVLMLVASCMVLVPLFDSLWAIVALLTIARSAGAGGSALNFALVTDVVRNRADVGKVTSLTVLGGQIFGVMGPIATGYVVGLTGSYNGSFVLAGALAVVGACATTLMTRRPIEAEHPVPAPALVA